MIRSLLTIAVLSLVPISFGCKKSNPEEAIHSGPPTITALNIGSITSNKAIIHATVNPNGLETFVRTQYSSNSQYSSNTAARSIGSGLTNVEVDDTLDFLYQATTYRWVLIADNSSGAASGGDSTFTTPSDPTGAADVVTYPPDAVTDSSAVLHASLNPHGLLTKFYFTYRFGSNPVTKTAPVTLNGTTAQSIDTKIINLAYGTEYLCEAVAENEAGQTTGGAIRFLTASRSPAIAANRGSQLSPTSAQLCATVYPHGLPTIHYFEYGLSSNYGNRTSDRQIDPASMPDYAQSQMNNVIGTINNLTENALYHWRSVATSSAGTTYGPDCTVLLTKGLRFDFPIGIGATWTYRYRGNILLQGMDGYHNGLSGPYQGIHTWVVVDALPGGTAWSCEDIIVDTLLYSAGPRVLTDTLSFTIRATADSLFISYLEVSSLFRSRPSIRNGFPLFNPDGSATMNVTTYYSGPTDAMETGRIQNGIGIVKYDGACCGMDFVDNDAHLELVKFTPP